MGWALVRLWGSSPRSHGLLKLVRGRSARSPGGGCSRRGIFVGLAVAQNSVVKRRRICPPLSQHRQRRNKGFSQPDAADIGRRGQPSPGCRQGFGSGMNDPMADSIRCSVTSRQRRCGVTYETFVRSAKSSPWVRIGRVWSQDGL